MIVSNYKLRSALRIKSIKNRDMLFIFIYLIYAILEINVTFKELNNNIIVLCHKLAIVYFRLLSLQLDRFAEA